MTEELRYLKVTGRFFLLVAAAVFCMAFVASWSFPVGLFLSFFGGLLLVVALLLGTAIFTRRGFALARRVQVHRSVIRLAAPLGFFVTIALSWVSLMTGSYTGTWTRLMVNWEHYQSIIDKAEHQQTLQQDPAPHEDGGVKFVVDAGPPVRVAFNPSGILDNWSAIVFDPTHEVSLANGFDETGKFRAPDRVTKLFGGDLISCRRIARDFFDCSFT